MKEGWTNRWKKLLIWVSGYLSIIAFVIVGGYFIIKGEDEELKKTAKLVFIVTIIFTAISAVLALYSSILTLAGASYTSTAYNIYEWLTSITLIAKIITFATFALLAFFGKNEKSDPEVIIEESK